MTESKFGILAASSTRRGICAVTLSDTRDDAINYLRKEYPRAEFVESEDGNHYLQGILEYLNGRDVNIPLDTDGTEFQKRVWSAIRKIPYGSTVTYSELASSIGSPHSFRAVANACAENPVPLIVPCHRVIRKNGDLGGYGLGPDRKKKILDHESARNRELNNNGK
jgi:AraC family transcriptional regulator of adaptative response/methylated-DNA-[protein]-cysteine methyltransferase